MEQTELSQKSNEIKSKTSQILKDETLKDQHYTIAYGDVGHTYDSIIGPYLLNAKKVSVEDPYIRAPHQIANFVRFCETVVKAQL